MPIDATNPRLLPMLRECLGFHTFSRCRLVGRPRHDCKPGNCRLAEHQKRALIQFIGLLDYAGQDPDSAYTQDTANRILERGHTDSHKPAPRVSKMWVYRLIRRLPEGYSKPTRRKPIDPKRIGAEELGIIDSWYTRLYILTRKYRFLLTVFVISTRFGFWRDRGVVSGYLPDIHIEIPSRRPTREA